MGLNDRGGVENGGGLDYSRAGVGLDDCRRMVGAES